MKKFSILFFPFVGITILFLFGYTFLHWLLIIRLELFHPKEMYLNFFGPCFFASIICFFYFYKRIKILKIGDKARDFYIFICIACMTAPVIAAQYYLEAGTGQLIEVERPTQISTEKLARYYSILNVSVRKNLAGETFEGRLIGKHNNKFRATIYFAAPLFDRTDTLHHKPPYADVWIVKSYSKTYSYHRSFRENKTEILQTFYKNSVEKYNKHIFHTNYLVNTIGSDDHEFYMQAVDNGHFPTNTRKKLILEEEEGDYDTRAEGYSIFSLAMLLGGITLWLIAIACTPMSPDGLRNYVEANAGKGKQNKEEQEWMLLFIPQKSNWAFPLIFDLNILIFLIMVFSGVDLFNPRTEQLIAWGANFKPLVENGEWWRLLTSTFLHAGIIHLVYNMFAFGMISFFLVVGVGNLKFMIIYLVCGISASICSLCLNESSVSVGASGAIFGMYGLFMGLMLVGYISRLTFGGMRKGLAIFIGINVVYGLMNGSIDMAAHMGGLLTGFLIGLGFFPFAQKKKKKRRIPAKREKSSNR